MGKAMCQTFSNVLQSKDVFVKHAKGMRDIVGKEIHPFHEIFMFLEGNAEFITEEGREPLSPGTVVVIPKGSFHQFTVHRKEEDYRRCVLRFGDRVEWEELIESKLKSPRTVFSRELKTLFLKLAALCDKPRDKTESEALAKALLTQILVYLPKDIERKSFSQASFHELTQKTIVYVTEHLSSTLGVASIASALFVSESYLAHVFKRDMRVSLHRYILEKKLIEANKRLKNGAKALEVALSLGFNDYSGFYKQYKKMFGISPALTRNAK